MKLYHFSNKEEIEEIQTNKRSALYCFDENEISDFSEYIEGGKVNVFDDIKEAYETDYESRFFDKAFFYGNFVHVIDTVDHVQLLNVTENIDKLRKENSEINEEFKKRSELEDEDEILENFYDTRIEVLINNYARKNGYDIVVWNDRTEGYPHRSYAVINEKILKKI